MLRICPSLIPFTKRALQFPHNRFTSPTPLMNGNTLPVKTVLVLGLGLGIILSFRSISIPSFVLNAPYSHVQLLSQFFHVYSCTSCNAMDQLNVFDEPYLLPSLFGDSYSFFFFSFNFNRYLAKFAKDRD